PQILRPPLAHECAFGPEALDDAIALELTERLTDGQAGHAKLLSELVHRGNARTDRPFASLDPAPEQGGELQIARDRALIEIDRRFAAQAVDTHRLPFHLCSLMPASAISWPSPLGHGFFRAIALEDPSAKRLAY